MNKRYLKQNSYVHEYFSQRARDNTYHSLYTSKKDNRESYNYKLRKKIILEYIKKLRNLDRSKILDAGCGTGEHASAIAQLNFEYVGFDFAWPMLSRAKEYNFPFCQGDVRNMPVKSASQRIILSLGVVEYIGECEKVFREFQRVLDKQGLLIFSTSTRFCFENWVKALLLIPRRFLSIFYYLLTGREPYRIKHFLMSRFFIQRTLQKIGFKIKERIYYNPNILCFPFSRIIPEGSMRLSRRLEGWANCFPFRFFTTAVIVVAVRE